MTFIWHPVELCQTLWPHAKFYDKQRELLVKVRTAAELYCVAGNELGKDWILGRLIVAFMYSPWTWYGKAHFERVDQGIGIPPRLRDLDYIVHGRRIVTTSVKERHLDVLWGEVGAAWRTCAMRDELDRRFVRTSKEIRFREEAEADRDAYSYAVGMVAGSENKEALTGHHAPYTLAACDEASGADDGVHKAFTGWAERKVYIGNPLTCHNFYKTNYRLGPLKATTSAGAAA